MPIFNKIWVIFFNLQLKICFIPVHIIQIRAKILVSSSPRLSQMNTPNKEKHLGLRQWSPSVTKLLGSLVLTFDDQLQSLIHARHLITSISLFLTICHNPYVFNILFCVVLIHTVHHFQSIWEAGKIQLQSVHHGIRTNHFFLQPDFSVTPLRSVSTTKTP